jgi:hypothetical protein
MNKFGIHFQWRNEHLKPKMLLFSSGNSSLNARKIGNCAMNDQRWWQLLDDARTLSRLRDETSANTPRFSSPDAAR